MILEAFYAVGEGKCEGQKKKKQINKEEHIYSRNRDLLTNFRN